jgi:hypothetical protein
MDRERTYISPSVDGHTHKHVPPTLAFWLHPTQSFKAPFFKVIYWSSLSIIKQSRMNVLWCCVVPLMVKVRFGERKRILDLCIQATFTGRKKAWSPSTHPFPSVFLCQLSFSLTCLTYIVHFLLCGLLVIKSEMVGERNIEKDNESGA